MQDKKEAKLKFTRQQEELQTLQRFIENQGNFFIHN